MSTRRASLAVALAALCAVAGLGGCKGNGAEASPAGGPRGRGERVVPVRTTSVQLGTLERVLERTGTLLTDRDVEVATQFGGRLVFVGVQVGDRVTAGELLAALDDREVTRARQEAAAGLDLADAGLRQASLDVERAERELARIQALVNEQLVTTQQADDARTAAAAAQAGRDLAHAQMEQARAHLETLLLQEAETRLVAPFDGQVADTYHEAGDTVPAGAAVVRLVGDGPLRARVQVPDYAAVQLDEGAEVAVTVDAFPGEAFPGVIAGVAPAVDPGSGTVVVEAAVEDPSARLLPGMFARITLRLPDRADVLLVPADAIVDAADDSGDSVFVVADGAARRKAIVAGASSEGWTEVIEGLALGDVVVSGGHHLLEDGAAVEVLDDGADGSIRGQVPGAEPSPTLSVGPAGAPPTAADQPALPPLPPTPGEPPASTPGDTPATADGGSTSR